MTTAVPLKLSGKSQNAAHWSVEELLKDALKRVQEHSAAGRTVTMAGFVYRVVDEGKESASLQYLVCGTRSQLETIGLFETASRIASERR